MRYLLLVLIFVGCDPVGLDRKVGCWQDSEGRVWTNPRLKQLHESGRIRLDQVRRSPSGCSPPDVMTRQEDIRRWCSKIH